MKLAICGGPRVLDCAWPSWPKSGRDREDRLTSALNSRRWASSGIAAEGRLFDRAFSEAFAAYLGVDHCVATDHGSSALVMALEALGIGVGDEVIVPGLTWTACATSVLRVNAKAVLVDIDPMTLCIDPVAIESAITPRTAAVMMVHLYSCMADVDAIKDMAARHGLFIIEDAAQAHGAHWNGHHAGTFGDIGVFSMQQGKVMTSGEGGAAVTSSSRLGAVLQQLRNDGRIYCEESAIAGPMELIESAGILGANRAPSEFQASLMLAGLEHLESETVLRSKNAQWLDQQLDGLPGCQLIQPYAKNSRRAYYHYALRIDSEAFAGRNSKAVSNALSAELGAWVHEPYTPLSRHRLATARRSRRYFGERLGVIECPEELHHCEHAAESVVLFHHPMLLADKTQLQAIRDAIEKVLAHADEIPN